MTAAAACAVRAYALRPRYTDAQLRIAWHILPDMFTVMAVILKRFVARSSYRTCGVSCAMQFLEVLRAANLEVTEVSESIGVSRLMCECE